MEETSTSTGGGMSNGPQGAVSKISIPLLSGVAKSFQQAIESHRRSETALGAHGEIDPLPQLDALDLAIPRGVVPPRVAGYDLLFQLKHGEHPFVSPAAHKDLVASGVPLTFRTSSYDLAVRAADAGQLAAADEIRVEDFVAAQNLALPAGPAGSLSIHAAASPSPLGEAGLHLLQISVKAGPKPAPVHAATRLIVVVDTSSLAASGARWEAIQRALMKISTDMAPSDRVTLIGFAARPRVLAENASGDDLRALVSTGKLPRPAGLSDLAVAISAACEAARTVQSNEPQRVVFVSAGGSELDDSTTEQSAQALAELAEAKIPWLLVNMAAQSDDGAFHRLAERGHGQAAIAHDAIDLHAALLKSLTGQAPTVASRVTLKVSFNPQVVTGYRLMGHEVATLTGPVAAPLEVEFPAGESATGLFELWVKPKGGELVAAADLNWIDATGRAPTQTRADPCGTSGLVVYGSSGLVPTRRHRRQDGRGFALKLLRTFVATGGPSARADRSGRSGTGPAGRLPDAGRLAETGRKAALRPQSHRVRLEPISRSSASLLTRNIPHKSSSTAMPRKVAGGAGL